MHVGSTLPLNLAYLPPPVMLDGGNLGFSIMAVGVWVLRVGAVQLLCPVCTYSVDRAWERSQSTSNAQIQQTINSNNDRIWVI